MIAYINKYSQFVMTTSVVKHGPDSKNLSEPRMVAISL